MDNPSRRRARPRLQGARPCEVATASIPSRRRGRRSRSTPHAMRSPSAPVRDGRITDQYPRPDRGQGSLSMVFLANGAVPVETDKPSVAKSRPYSGLLIRVYGHNAGFRKVCTFPRPPCGADPDFVKARCERGDDACYVSALFRFPTPTYYCVDRFFELNAHPSCQGQTRHAAFLLHAGWLHGVDPIWWTVSLRCFLH